MRITALLLLIAGSLLGGCANTGREVPLPENRQQPRLAEFLVYLEYRGVEDAGKAPVFEMSHWLMYDDPNWDQNPRKPRFEGAELTCREMRIIVAVSPIKAAVSEDRFVRSEKEKDGKKQVVGATLLPAGMRWSVGFTMARPDEMLQKELEGYLSGFVKQFAGR